MELLIFDWETTSPEPSSARGVQIAAVSHPIIINAEGTPQLGESVVILNSLCNPGVDIHHEAAKIHGISTEMVKDAPPDTHFAAMLYDYVKERKGKVIFGFQNGVTFDLLILMRLAAMHPDGKIRAPFWDTPYIDTLVTAVRTLPDAPSHRLSVPLEEQNAENPPGLIQYLQLDPGKGAHDAATDCHLVLLLIKLFIEELIGDVRRELAVFVAEGKLELTEEQRLNPFYMFSLWCKRPRILRVCHFGKHKGKLWGKVAKDAPKSEKEKYVHGGYIHYIVGKFEPTPDLAATIWHHYRRKFVKPMRG